MKAIEFATRCITILFIFFIAYNTYFGWNELPLTESEKTCDLIFTKGISISIIIYFIPIIKVYKKWIENSEKQ